MGEGGGGDGDGDGGCGLGEGGGGEGEGGGGLGESGGGLGDGAVVGSARAADSGHPSPPPSVAAPWPPMTCAWRVRDIARYCAIFRDKSRSCKKIG